MAGNPKLRVENLTKDFGDIVAVDNISLTAAQGDITTFLGPSGCGKTTTLRCIAGLERPTSGKIFIGDELVTDGEEIIVAPEDRDLGMVFQSYAIWPHMDVKENISYGLKIRGLNKDEREERVKEVLDIIGLNGMQDKRSSALSGGQQQRVVLGRSLAYNPEVMLLDEPLANLDAQLRRKMQGELNKIQEEMGVTSIYVTHNQEEGLFLSDKIMVMDDGEIAERGEPRLLYNYPQKRHTANFLGKSNLIPVTSKIKSNGNYKYNTDIGTYETPDEPTEIDDDPMLFIRPDNIFISGNITERKFDEKGIQVTGIIQELEFLGDFTEYTILINGTNQEVNVSSTTTSVDYEIGDEIDCFFPHRHAKIL